MPRTKGPEKSLLKAMVPVELRGRLDLELISEIEGRVPQGKYSEFVEARLREHFSWDTLNLEAYGLPAGYFVRGPKEMLQALLVKLTEPR